MEGIDLQRFARTFTENLEPPTRKHLKNVYATFTLACLCAAGGGYAHVFSSILQAGMLSSFGAIGCLIWLACKPYENGKKQPERLGLLAAFAFLTGCNLGPLLQLAIVVNPALIMQALLGTAVVFACFSFAALFAPRGHFLYLGGTLMACLSTLFWLSLMNIFFGSRLLFEVNLYLGLAVMCGFIVFDTQHIVEKARSGNKDYIMHAVELFIDFIAVFRRLLIILTNKEAQDKKRRKN